MCNPFHRIHVVRWGLYESAKQYVGWPITPGFEFSGVVTHVGDAAAAEFAVGDPVFGVTVRPLS